MTRPHEKDPITPQEVERQLANDPRPTPPLELLDRIRQEIPDELDTASPGGHPGGPRRQTWLIAATLATVVLGSFLAWRLGELNRWSARPTTTESTAVQERVVVPTTTAPDTDTNGARTEDQVGGRNEGIRTDELKRNLPTETEAVTGSSDSYSGGDGDRTGRTDEARDQQSQPAAKVDTRESDETSQTETLLRGLMDQASTDSDSAPRERSVAREPLASEEALVGNTQSLVQSSVGREEAEVAARRKIAPTPAAPPSTGGTHEPNNAPYGDMFFKGYGTNPFLDPEEDRLSTFGLDVDTGSYTLARSYLERGNLPPAEAIRVEEFL